MRRHLLLAIAVGGAACGHRESGIRVLPIRAAEPVLVGDEARPARLIPTGSRLRWAIPASGPGTLEIGLARLKAARGNIVVRAYRGPGRAPGELLGSRNIGPEAAWTTWRLPWRRAGGEKTLSVEIVSGEEKGSPAASPVVLAEPLLLPAREESRRPNAVVFLVDTLRADQLGCYGKRDAGTPAFDRLADEGWLVERALSSANWTLPAHASLFTSTDVARHGVNRVNASLPSSLPTLAGVLRRAGYRTLAATNGGYLDPHFGLARGFDRYVSAAAASAPAPVLIDRAIDLIRDSPDEPWFLFVQTYQVHEYIHHLSPEQEAAADPERRAALLIRQYGTDLAATDAAFDRFRSALGRFGVARRTPIIVLSDHGDVFADSIEGCPARFAHGTPCLHDDENRIPFIVFDPRAPAGGRRVDAPVSILDVAPTVLSLLGLPAEGSFDGIAVPDPSRAAAIAPGRRRVTEEPQSDSLAVERDRWKLIVRPDRLSILSKWTSAPASRLAPVVAFDLRGHPREDAPVPAGRRSPLLDGLMREASDLVTEHFPGSLVVRIPRLAERFRITVTAEGGLRSFDKFAGGEPELDQVEWKAGAITATVAPSNGAAWLVFEPRRRIAALAVEIESAAPVELGSGRPLEAGETRDRWSSLLGDSKRPPSTDAVLLAASSLRARDGRGIASPPSDATMAQLKALGYLNFSSSPGARSTTPLSGVGSGRIRIRWSPREP